MTKLVLFLKAQTHIDKRRREIAGAAHHTGLKTASSIDSEIGQDEQQRYGIYHRPGNKVRDREGNIHTVIEHTGSRVHTLSGGSFHPKKLTPVAELDPHPSVVGKATEGDAQTFKFGGKQYHHTGQEGNSLHDGTSVQEAKSANGHRVWRDQQDRIHADSEEEVKYLRGY